MSCEVLLTLMLKSSPSESVGHGYCYLFFPPPKLEDLASSKSPKCSGNDWCCHLEDTIITVLR